MIKSNPRRDFILGGLLIALGVALVIHNVACPNWELPKAFGTIGLRAAPYVRRLPFPVLLAGVVEVLRGMWGVMPGAAVHDGAAGWLRRNRKRLLATLTCVFAVLFLALTSVSLHLRKPRGEYFVLGDELVRMGALLSGVLFLLGLMSMVLPLLLNLLEGRSFVSLMSARHVRATKSGFLTVISVLSIAGVAVSSCALVSVVSIMGGFGQDLKRKILGNNAHITIDTQAKEGFGDWQTVLDRTRAVGDVAAATPVVSGEAMISSPSNTAGVMVRGVDYDSIGNVIDLRKNIEAGHFEYLADPEKLTRLPANEVIGLGPRGEPYYYRPDLGMGSWSGSMPPTGIDPDLAAVLKTRPVHPGVVIGRELAKTLHVYVGDDVSLVSPLGDLGPMGIMPRTRRFRVAAVFYSGMYEYDATHVYVVLPVGQELFSLKGNISTIDVRAVDGERATTISSFVQGAIERPDLRVRDWRELNKNLFSALKLERIATFIILSIAIAVASFCIVCTLLLMVTEKGKEIGILKALGASNQSVMTIFMLEGVVIGAIGTAFGVATGVSLCLGLSWYGLRLDPSVYYIDQLPIAINWADYGLVAVCAMAICTIATIYPALAASKLRPVEALRYE